MRSEIRVKFAFRKKDQKIWYADFFTRILNKRYLVVIDEYNPDFIFHESHLVDVLKYSGVRISIAGENVRPDFNISDYGIGFDHMVFQDRYLRYPLYLMYSGSLKKAEERENSIREISDLNLFGRKFCNFLVSNGNATDFRTRFFYQLSEYKEVESGGAYLNNIGQKVANKYQWQKEFKFSLCFENSSTSGYLTEKLIQAYAANTIPIYWGDPDAFGLIKNNKGGINSKAIVCVDREFPNNAIQKIKELDSNLEKYISTIKQPLFLEIDHSSKFNQELEEFIFSIFDQKKERAFRRGFGQIRLRVESRNIARSNIIKSFFRFLTKRLKS